MAGIGFELRKLAQQDDLLGVLRGYAHCAVVSTGPWVFTILSLGAITLFGPRFATNQELVGFRLLIIYNFAFSLVMSGPVILVATRYLSDLIYAKKFEEAPGMMLGCLVLLYGSQALIVGSFYFFYLELDFGVRLAAFANFFLITGIWLVSQFLSALKDYAAITRAFGIGMFLAMTGTFVMAPVGSVAGMLVGFSGGLAYILFSLIARVYIEYPHGVVRPFAVMKYFSKYWELAVGGLVYNLAIWIDKWIMWFSPHRETLAYGMISYPDYDGAMFLAYLSILPAMALFVYSVETEFFENYLQFYRDIQRQATYDRIDQNHRKLMQSTLGSSRSFFVVQGSVTLTVILLAPKIFSLFGISFTQLGIFRLGVLGALFHALFLFLSIYLSYFDLRRVALWLQLLFLIANGGLTYLTLKLGFPYYGLGYLMASLIAFVAAFLATHHHLRRLPYQTFVRSNASAR